MVTLASAENALKNVYLGVVANQLNINANPLLAKIKHTNKDIAGKEVRKLAPFGINGGIGAGSEDGELPYAIGNSYVQFVSELKNLYGKIEISDKAIRSSTNSVGAFVNLLTDEMEGLIKASTFNLGRMLYGDGTGLLGTVVSVSDNVLTMDSVKNFIEGMALDVYASAGTKSNKNPIRVAYVDRANKQITVSASEVITFVTGDTFYVQGSKGYEITGLKAIFEADTLYGVDKTTYKWMNPYISAPNSEVEISDILIQKAVDYLEEVAGSQINFISCSSSIRRAYQEYLGAYRRNIDITELEGGYKTITHNGIPVVADRFVDDDTIYLLNTDDFELQELCDWRWLEGEDGRIIKQNANTPTYYATLVKYAELICNKPNGQAKLTKISSTVSNPFAS